MPIIKSAKKALRQSKRRAKFNLQRKKTLKDVVLKFKKLKEGGKNDEAAKLLSQVYKAIDKASKRGVIKRGTASRKKSRLAKSLKK